jgi:tetratricopeptide (TPR) repeat protein
LTGVPARQEPGIAGIGRRAIALVDDPVRAALLHESLGRFLVASGSYEAGLAAFRTAVEVVPAEPVAPERAHVLAALGNALMLGWRHDESRQVCGQALALARQVGARRSEFRALAVLEVDLAYLGRTEEGIDCLWEALHLAEDSGEPQDLGRAYILLTDVLTMLGRPRESVRLAATGIALARKHGREHGADIVLVVNLIEALTDLGEWQEADRVGSAAIRAGGSQWPDQRLVARAALDIGRGDFDRARADLQAALATVHEDKRGRPAFDMARADLALWERRWDDAERAVGDGLRRLPALEAAFLRAHLCAQGLRAQAELAALARARRDRDAVVVRLDRARKLLDMARAAAVEAAAVTPTAAAWRAVAEAEHDPRPGAAEPASLGGGGRRLGGPPAATGRRLLPMAAGRGAGRRRRGGAGRRRRPRPGRSRRGATAGRGRSSGSWSGWCSARGWTSRHRADRPARHPGSRSCWG